MKQRFGWALAILFLGLSCVSVEKPEPNELVARTSPIQVGEKAPNFTLEDQHNQNVSLSAARGKMPVVLVFYRGHW